VKAGLIASPTPSFHFDHCVDVVHISVISDSPQKGHPREPTCGRRGSGLGVQGSPLPPLPSRADLRAERPKGAPRVVVPVRELDPRLDHAVQDLHL